MVNLSLIAPPNGTFIYRISTSGKIEFSLVSFSKVFFKIFRASSELVSIFAPSTFSSFDKNRIQVMKRATMH